MLPTLQAVILRVTDEPTGQVNVRMEFEPPVRPETNTTPAIEVAFKLIRHAAILGTDAPPPHRPLPWWLNILTLFGVVVFAALALRAEDKSGYFAVIVWLYILRDYARLALNWPNAA